jgi:hypothetical protein
MLALEPLVVLPAWLPILVDEPFMVLPVWLPMLLPVPAPVAVPEPFPFAGIVPPRLELLCVAAPVEVVPVVCEPVPEFTPVTWEAVPVFEPVDLLGMLGVRPPPWVGGPEEPAPELLVGRWLLVTPEVPVEVP